MRLGKSLLIIRWIKQLADKPRRILVLAPLTTLGGWERELRLEGEQFLSEYGTARTHRVLDAFELHNADVSRRLWFLTNYQIMLNSSIQYLNWDVVVASESTTIKNARAKTTREACGGFRSATHRIIESGMPNPESDLDLVSQFIFLYGDFMGYSNFWEWRARNCQMVRGEWFVSRKLHAVIKKYLHRQASVLSRKQAGIGSRTVYERRDIPMPAVLKKAYTQAKRDFAITLHKAESEEDTSAIWEGNGSLSTNIFQTKWQIVLETWLGRLAGGFDPEGKLLSDHKLVELVSLLTGELSKEQVVVSFRFNAALSEADRCLRQAGLKPSVLWGKTPAEERTEVQRRFQAGLDRVVLVQASLARFGLDFSAADTLVHFERYFSGEINNQIEQRIIHPAKTAPVLVVDLVTKGSTDEIVVEAAKAKKINSKMLLTQLMKEWKK